MDSLTKAGSRRQRSGLFAVGAATLAAHAIATGLIGLELLFVVQSDAALIMAMIAEVDAETAALLIAVAPKTD